MNRAPRLECRLGGMPTPEKIISYGINAMGTGFPAWLLIRLAVLVLRPGGTHAACIAITEPSTSGTTIRKAPVIGATRLGTGVTAAAITEAPVIGTALIGTTVAITAILKTPFVEPTLTIAPFETPGRP